MSWKRHGPFRLFRNTRVSWELPLTKIAPRKSLRSALVLSLFHTRSMSLTIAPGAKSDCVRGDFERWIVSGGGPSEVLHEAAQFFLINIILDWQRGPAQASPLFA